MYRIILLLVFILISKPVDAGSKKSASSAVKIARIKYSGGGDWYNDPSSEVNLLKYINKNSNIKVDPTYQYIDLATDNIFYYPIVYLTGHGNLRFSDKEASNLRAYLRNGGFLYIDDDYGLDKYIRKEMKKIFPEQEFAELSFKHGIYTSHFKFKHGLPKIHEHDKSAPRGYGLMHEGRMCVFYTFESNLGDGWADQDLHNDPPEKREESLKMGANIIIWALTN